MLKGRPAVDVDDRWRPALAAECLGVGNEEERGNILAVRARIADVHGLRQRRRIDRRWEGARERARLCRPLAGEEHVPRVARAREEEHCAIAVGADGGRCVDSGKVRHRVVRMRDREHPAQGDRGVLIVKVVQRASVGTPDGAVLVMDVVGQPFDPSEDAPLIGRGRDLLTPPRVGRERNPRAVRRPATIDGLAVDATAGLEAPRLPARSGNDEEIGVRSCGVAGRPKQEQRAIGRPARLGVVARAVADRALDARRDIDDVHGEGFLQAGGVRGVRELGAVG